MQNSKLSKKQIVKLLPKGYRKNGLIIIIIILIVLFFSPKTSITPNTPGNKIANSVYQLNPTQSMIFHENITKQINPTVSANPAQVLYVIDGDTFVLSNKQSVRLIGIDTPEKGQCYYSEAKRKLEQLIKGKTIGLVKDVSDTDKYGRFLRYVYIDGLFVNNELVRQGYATIATYPPDIAYADLFLASQKYAREKKLGLWSVNCIK